MLEATHNIDTIIVNPADEERVRAAFLANNLEKFANMIVPCVYVERGRILAFSKDQPIQVCFEFGG